MIDRIAFCICLSEDDVAWEEEDAAGSRRHHVPRVRHRRNLSKSTAYPLTIAMFVGMTVMLSR